MSAARFDLTSVWRVEGTRQEVWAVLTDVRGFTRWWSDVYLAVDVLDEGDADGVGAVLAVHSRGWLPYRLRWRGRVVEARRPEALALEASGDLAGRGRWTLTQAAGGVIARYGWQVVAERPPLRRLAPLLKPALAANHRWAMARGEAGLRRELAERRCRLGARGASEPEAPGNE